MVHVPSRIAESKRESKRILLRKVFDNLCQHVPHNFVVIRIVRSFVRVVISCFDSIIFRSIGVVLVQFDGQNWPNSQTM